MKRANKDGLGGVTKSGLGGNNKGGINEANIKAGVRVGENNKSRISRIDRGRVSRIDIKAGKKACAEVNASTNYSTDSDSDDEVTDQYAGLKNIAIAALAAAINLLLSTATFTSDKFLVAFTSLANTILKKKVNICKSILSGFICY